jgi:hypothetical protein
MATLLVLLELEVFVIHDLVLRLGASMVPFTHS